jgi:TPR repeat protein
VKTDPENPLSLSKAEVDCPECPSGGRISTEVTFTLVCSSKAVPPLPEKPRVVRQRLLVGKADAGDSFSQVEYGTQLENGTETIDQNVDLARDYFVKAAIQGNGHGLDGAVRTVEAAGVVMPKKGNLLFMLKLVQAKLVQEVSGRASYYVNANELGVSIPSEMSYIDVKTAEILARTFRSYFLSKDLEPRHFSFEGSLALFMPMKKQMEKAPIVAARAKVEYVLISHALSAPIEVLDSDRLSLIKEAAVSLDSTAFGILGDISSAGTNGPKNYQAASIFYKISQRLSKDKLVESRLDALQFRYDKKTTEEMVEEFEKTKVAGRANVNFIEAMLKINAQNNDLKK